MTRSARRSDWFDVVLRVSSIDPAQPLTGTVRFHLHPAVQASPVADGGAAIFRLPGGAVWRLRAAGAEMSLGESIYLGSGEARKTQQVVLSATTGPEGAVVRWAVRREPKPSGSS